MPDNTASSKDDQVELGHQSELEYIVPVGPLAENAAEYLQANSKEERQLVLRQDLIIIPLLSLGYMFGYLDRGQIGNARLMGLEKALGLTNQQYFQALMIFFVGFLLAEIPGALLMRVVRAQWIFGGAILFFGVFATLITVSGGFAGLMVLRLLLGLCEAIMTLGFLYLSLWYRPDELALRSGLIYVSTPIAGFTSGLVAYGVAKNLTHTAPFATWQWLFFVEGIPTIVLGLIVIIFLPGLPDRVAKGGHFLFRGTKYREMLLTRQTAGQNTANAKIVPKQILIGIKDPKSYLGALVIAAPALGITAFAIFLPTFMKEFGFDPLHAQLYTIIPYSFAIVSTPLLCYISDKTHMRAMPMIFCLFTSIVGFVILLSTVNKVALIAGCCFVATGAYPAIGIGASWISTIHGGYTKRSTAFGISQIFVQGYSIIGTQVYDEPPRFYKGHGVLLGLYCLALLSCLILYLWCKKMNRERDASITRLQNEQEKTGTGVDVVQTIKPSFEDLCDYHPDWRYPI